MIAGWLYRARRTAAGWLVLAALVAAAYAALRWDWSTLPTVAAVLLCAVLAWWLDRRLVR